MAKPHAKTEILAYLRMQFAAGVPSSPVEAITANVTVSRPTVNRYLAKMVAAGELLRLGAGPATRYALPSVRHTEDAPPPSVEGFHFSTERTSLIERLLAPIGTRSPVTYQRAFVDNYVPNQSALLPSSLAADLFAQGRANGQQPAGTYARKVLEQLLIDLAWHSSRLEGNRKSMLDTKELFARGRARDNDLDATMLLNHKDAIEFLVDEVPHYGITEAVVRNVQSLLMQGLLVNADGLGAIRRTVVSITDSVYVPTQAPQLLEEMLTLIVDKARQTKNPIEAAFFLWVNLAYLQPFEDGNKRTGRLCANLPLLLQNCAPLSFLDVETPDYALAMIAIYERLDVSLAVELFAWTYRRSIDKYTVILEAMGAPDPFRSRYREELGEAIRRVINQQIAVDAALKGLGIPLQDQAVFRDLLRSELRHLEAYNCARYRLSIRLTEEWIRQGRPGL